MLLAFRDVSLRLGSTVLLDTANFTIETGERVCLIGRNGAGKSTLMRVASGEVKPEEGEVVRTTGVKIARLEQDVPRAESITVYDLVAQGLGDLGEVVAEYHRLALQADPDLKRMGALQARIDAENAWQLESRVHAIVERVSQRRLSYLFDCYRALGMDQREADHWSRFAYATFVGNLQIRRDIPDAIPEGPAFAEYLKLMIKTLIPRARGEESNTRPITETHPDVLPLRKTGSD